MESNLEKSMLGPVHAQLQHAGEPPVSSVKQAAEKFLAGALDIDGLIAELAAGRTAWQDSVSIDVDRQRRCGMPEAIFGQGKSLEQLKIAVNALRCARQNVLITRIDSQIAHALSEFWPDGSANAVARTWRCMWQEKKSSLNGENRDGNTLSVVHGSQDEVCAVPPLAKNRCSVAVITAGATDLPVAEEALETLAWMEVKTRLISDAGVAGPYRMLARAAELHELDAVVVVAGMEGALPSVVAGYVRCPVIAVPTSVGYGANFAGLSALLSMLNSCAPHVAVVNIDAGFKGGYLAGMIARSSVRTVNG